MAYTLNQYYQASFIDSNAPRVIVYPNNTTAAQLLNHHNNGANVIRAADCLLSDDMRLPMPDALMNNIDAKIEALGCRAIVVGLDSYLALLDSVSVSVFMSELMSRLDNSILFRGDISLATVTVVKHLHSRSLLML